MIFFDFKRSMEMYKVQIVLCQMQIILYKMFVGVNKFSKVKMKNNIIINSKIKLSFLFEVFIIGVF